MSALENTNDLDVANLEPQKGGGEKLAGLFAGDREIPREIRALGGEEPSPNFTKQACIKNLQPEDGNLEAPLPDVVEPCEAGRPLAMLVPVSLRKGGRPSVFTPDFTERLCMLLTVGLSRNQAAAYLGIDRSSIGHAVSRDPDLAAQLRHAEELADLQPELTLIAASRKSWRAAAWYLKYKKKHPRPLTPEELEEHHQKQIESGRRLNEMLRDSANHSYQLRDQQLRDWESPPVPPKRRAGAKRRKEA